MVPHPGLPPSTHNTHLEHVWLVGLGPAGRAGRQAVDVAAHIVPHNHKACTQLVCKRGCAWRDAMRLRGGLRAGSWGAAPATHPQTPARRLFGSSARPPPEPKLPGSCTPQAGSLTHDGQDGAADVQQLRGLKPAVRPLHLAHQLAALLKHRHGVQHACLRRLSGVLLSLRWTAAPVLQASGNRPANDSSGGG